MVVAVSNLWWVGGTWPWGTGRSFDILVASPLTCAAVLRSTDSGRNRSEPGPGPGFRATKPGASIDRPEIHCCNYRHAIWHMLWPTPGGRGAQPPDLVCGPVESVGVPGTTGPAGALSIAKDLEESSMALAPEQAGIGIRRHFTTAGRPPLRRGRVGAPRRPHHQLSATARSPSSSSTSRCRSTGRSTPPTSSPRSTSAAPSAPPSARRRCARSPTGWSTPSPRGASTAATSSTTREAEAFRAELKHLDRHPEGGVQLAGVVQHRRARRAAAGRGLLHPRRRRHDGLDPQLVRRGGHDLQGRVGRRASTCRASARRRSC